MITRILFAVLLLAFSPALVAQGQTLTPEKMLELFEQDSEVRSVFFKVLENHPDQLRGVAIRNAIYDGNIGLEFDWSVGVFSVNLRKQGTKFVPSMVFNPNFFLKFRVIDKHDPGNPTAERRFKLLVVEGAMAQIEDHWEQKNPLLFPGEEGLPAERASFLWKAEFAATSRQVKLAREWQILPLMDHELLKLVDRDGIEEGVKTWMIRVADKRPDTRWLIPFWERLAAQK
jgi:hypothetical protein